MNTFARSVGISATVTVALLLVGCASPQGQPTETVVMMADYPTYPSIAALEADADLVVEVELGESREDVMLPDYGSDDPQVNPYAGTDTTPDPRAGAVPITGYSATITAVHQGDAAKGDVIEVKQMGGVLDSIQYEIEEVANHSADKPFLLFLTTYPDSPASILGGDVGAFESQNGRFVSLGDDNLVLTSDDLDALR